MKSAAAERVVIRWTCLKHPDIRHLSQQSAEMCIARYLKRKPTRTYPILSPALYRAMFLCRLDGGSWTECGVRAGVSERRAAQLVRNIVREIKRKMEGTGGGVTRGSNSGSLLLEQNIWG